MAGSPKMSSHYREMIVAEAIDVFVGAVCTHSEFGLYFCNTRSPTWYRQVRADGPRAQLASLLASTWRVDESRMKYLLELHKPQVHSEQTRARNHGAAG